MMSLRVYIEGGSGRRVMILGLLLLSPVVVVVVVVGVVGVPVAVCL
jgi:hypothetical protein